MLVLCPLFSFVLNFSQIFHVVQISHKSNLIFLFMLLHEAFDIQGELQDKKLQVVHTSLEWGKLQIFFCAHLDADSTWTSGDLKSHFYIPWAIYLASEVFTAHLKPSNFFGDVNLHLLLHFVFLPLQMWQSSLKEGICQGFTAYLCSEIVRMDSPLPPILKLGLPNAFCLVHRIFPLGNKVQFLSMWHLFLPLGLLCLHFSWETLLVNALLYY